MGKMTPYLYLRSRSNRRGSGIDPAIAMWVSVAVVLIRGSVTPGLADQAGTLVQTRQEMAHDAKNPS